MSAPAPEDHPDACPLTILGVEDDVLVRLAITEHLRDCGYRVLEAASGDEAIAVLAAADTDVDLVFSDIQMPGTQDGFALAQWIRSHRPDLKVILTSGWHGAVGKAEGICHDGPIMPKPYDHAVVQQRIRKMLGRRGGGAS